MNKIEEIEQAVERLQSLRWLLTTRARRSSVTHSAFLNSYAPQDEGLYDDAATR